MQRTDAIQMLRIDQELSHLDVDVLIMIHAMIDDRAQAFAPAPVTFMSWAR